MEGEYSSLVKERSTRLRRYRRSAPEPRLPSTFCSTPSGILTPPRARFFVRTRNRLAIRDKSTTSPARAAAATPAGSGTRELHPARCAKPGMGLGQLPSLLVYCSTSWKFATFYCWNVLPLFHFFKCGRHFFCSRFLARELVRLFLAGSPSAALIAAVIS